MNLLSHWSASFLLYPGKHSQLNPGSVYTHMEFSSQLSVPATHGFEAMLITIQNWYANGAKTEEIEPHFMNE